MKSWIVLIYLILTCIASAKAGSVQDIITKVSTRYGVNSEYMCRLAYVESRTDPLAKNPKSSASGLFQIINSTEAYYAKKYNLRGDIFNANYNTTIATFYTLDSYKYLRKKRLPITMANLYAVHFFGPSKAYRFLTTRSSGKLKDLFPKAYKYNKGLFRNRTVSQLKRIFKNKFINAKGCS